jgi:hypothetical protein
VARPLEHEWEAALAERAHLGEEYERYQRGRPARLSPAELAAIRALAGDIPALWAAPATTMADRKRLLRVVIESVQVTADGATERVHATVTWAGGQQTHADLLRPVARIDQLSYYPALMQRIRALASRCSSTSSPASVYSTLNRRRTSSAIRASVQHWSSQPQMAGPASSTASSSRTCAGVSLHRAPPAPLEASAARPPAASAATGSPTSATPRGP